MKKKIVIFASGSGTNAERIMSEFEGDETVEVVKIFCNKKNAGVIARGENFGVETIVFDRTEFVEKEEVQNLVKEINPDLIILAGFLLKMPERLVESFEDKIVNIHPALLPKFGGKGMYGANVHKAVLEQKEKVSGITIHFVNEEYDDGKVIFQAEVKVEENDTPESLQKKIHALEHKHFPIVIRKVLNA